MASFSLLDKLILELDTALQTLIPPAQRTTARPFPAEGLKNGNLSPKQIQHVAGLMRVNHSGEVCAQALYQGQALVSSSLQVQNQLREAAHEEKDHLDWCERCLKDLNGQVSVLNPFWYASSFVLGACMGMLGDTISLGFVAEVEKQVEEHLREHLQNLPPQTAQCRAVLEQMQKDEAEHAHAALNTGGILFPEFVRKLMRRTAKCMTKSSYYV